jgi:hypothetical protein
MTRPAGIVLNPGDEIGFRLQSDEDAYVIVFNIDTEGYVNLLYPARGERPVHVREGDTYLIPDDNSETLVVEGNTGVEFVFALVVPERDDIDRRELDFLGKANDLPPEERYRIDGDPFIAANIIAGELIRGISRREGVYLDYQYFYINERVIYPCYLCGECDGAQTESDCADFLVSANFVEDRPLQYPLPRAYEMIELAVSPALEDDVDLAQSTDDRAYGQYRGDGGDVNINFYPYNSEVYYETRETLTGARNVDVYVYGWEPGWYDPWAAGWYYYPTVSYGFYWGYPAWGWGFNWGWWGGYYCSSWYWPRCYGVYDCYSNYYCYYDGGYRYTPERYKDKYYAGDTGSTRRVSYKDKYAATTTGAAFKTAYSQSAKRDNGLKLASGGVGTKSASTKYRTSSKTAYRSTKTRTSGGNKAYVKTTGIRGYGSSAKSKYAYSSRKSYTPRTRTSYAAKSTRSSVKSTGLKARSTRTKPFDNPTFRSGKSRTSTKSSYDRTKSGSTVPKSRSGSAYKRTTNKSSSKSYTTKKRSTNKSSYKPTKRSTGSRKSSVKSPSRSSTRSPARSSGARKSSGGRTKSSGKGRR